jgi:hypothetical protein
MNLILTTFPEATSANVGDLLITTAFAEFAQSAGVLHQYETVFRRLSLTDDQLDRFKAAPVFAPGMSVSSNSYPKLYALRDRIDDIPAGLIPFGCTWQHPIGYPENAEVSVFSDEMSKLLSRVIKNTGPIAVRDHMTAGILTRNGFASIVVGDCGWYHLPSQGKPMRRPRTISKIVVTTPHSADLTSQSIDLIEALCGIFPEAKITVSFHSRPTGHASELLEYATSKGFEILLAAGDVTVFDKYEEYDLHVGHRLHGHIGFIRRRIPSVLLIEDARSRGFSSSMPVGCFAAKKAAVGPEILARLPLALAREHVTPDAQAVPRIREFLTEELSSGFLRYIGISHYLDAMLTDIVIPQIKEKVVLANQAIGSQ